MKFLCRSGRSSSRFYMPADQSLSRTTEENNHLQATPPQGASPAVCSPSPPPPPHCRRDMELMFHAAHADEVGIYSAGLSVPQSRFGWLLFGQTRRRQGDRQELKR